MEPTFRREFGNEMHETVYMCMLRLRALTRSLCIKTLMMTFSYHNQPPMFFLTDMMGMNHNFFLFLYV